MQKPTPIQNLSSIALPFIGTILILGILWFGYQTFFGAKKTTNNQFLAQKSNNPASPSTTPNTIAKNDLIVPSAEVDSDNDGLSNAMEALYKTDPSNPDTDGDGYKDGDEVANGYDPLIKSPNDKIDRLTTKIGTNNATSSPLPSPSLTQMFVNKTGITPTDQNIAQKEAQINQFINETNARGILPIILDSDLKITSATGKTAIVKYLDTLSVAKNTKLKTVTPEEITTAFTTLTSKNSSTALDKVIADLRNNTEIFRAVAVPKEVVELHKKYLSAVSALQTNTEALKNYKTDYVSVLVAASRIEGLRTVFTEVGKDIKALETKYGIK